MLGKSLFIQISDYFKDTFNKWKCGFRKSYNTHQCQLKTLGKWKRSVDNCWVFDALLRNLCKALLTDELINYGLILWCEDNLFKGSANNGHIIVRTNQINIEYINVEASTVRNY